MVLKLDFLRTPVPTIVTRVTLDLEVHVVVVTVKSELVTELPPTDRTEQLDRTSVYVSFT